MPNGVDSSSWVLLRAAAAVAIAIGAGGCESVTDADPLEPTRTPPPSQSDGNIAWLGARYGDLGFHSVDKHLRPAVFVNYGNPTPPDPGSGDVWHFPLQVMTAPRRAETRRRLQRALRAGVVTKLGISYGCRHPQGPRRVAVLTATQRIEITGTDCPDLLRASRHLRLLTLGLPAAPLWLPGRRCPKSSEAEAPEGLGVGRSGRLCIPEWFTDRAVALARRI